MIKKMRLACVVFLVAASSYANVSFKWANNTLGSATYWNNAPTEPKTYANVPFNYTLLTYISGDSTISFDTGAPMATSYGSGFGQDVLVGATNTLFTGKLFSPTYTLGAAGTGAGSYVGSYAYCVLVNLTLANFSGIYGGDVTQLPMGTLYGLSTAVKLNQYDIPPELGVPQIQQITTTTAVANIALVPEPSTFALLGIGLGLVGLRRFRRK